MIKFKRSIESGVGMLLPALIALLISCQDQPEHPAIKQVHFSIEHVGSSHTNGGRAKDLPTPAGVIVTIRNTKGEVVVDQKTLDLHQFGNSYLSVPLTLPSSPGRFYLTEFMVIGSDQKVEYASPREGSNLGHLVSDPLDIEFAVSKDSITTISPEVLAVDDSSSPSDFGYGQFGFNEVKKIQVVFSSFVKGPANFELTESHLKIEGLKDSTSAIATALWTYETDLAAKANIISLRKAVIYRVTATKTGYAPWVKTISLQNEQAIEIIFEETSSNVFTKLWNISYGGGGAYVVDYITSSTSTPDGGVLVLNKAAFITSSYLRRLNRNGEMVWRKEYPSDVGYLHTVGSLSDGSNHFYMAGQKSAGLMIKIDGAGGIIWEKSIPNTTGIYDIVPSLHTGNIVVNGFRTGYSVVAEMNGNGEILWQKEYKQDDNYVYGLSRLGDGYALTQTYGQFEYKKGKITKLDLSGEIQWTNAGLPFSWHGQKGNSGVFVKEVDNGYLAFGIKKNVNLPGFDCSTNLPNGETDVVVAALSKDGAILWEKVLGDADHEKLADVEKLSNGNFLIGGVVHRSCQETSAFDPKWYLLVVSPSGEIISETVFNGSMRNNSNEKPSVVMEGINKVSDSEFVIAGHTNIIDGDTPPIPPYYRVQSDIWVMRIKF